jgi:hypothetical protein
VRLLQHARFVLTDLNHPTADTASGVFPEMEK